MMQKVQKTYTQEFKREAVRLAQSSGKPIAQVARELGISDSSIHQWRKELAEHGPEAFPESRASDGLGGRKSSSETGTGENATRT
jgi:transposase